MTIINLLRKASERFHYSGRTIHKYIKIARTIADIEDEPPLTFSHLKKSLLSRDLEKIAKHYYIGGKKVDVYWIWLSQIKYVGPVSQKKIALRICDSPKAIYFASQADLEKIPRISKRALNQSWRTAI